jgi:hypothetical protein
MQGKSLSRYFHLFFENKEWIKDCFSKLVRSNNDSQNIFMLHFVRSHFANRLLNELVHAQASVCLELVQYPFKLPQSYLSELQYTSPPDLKLPCLLQWDHTKVLQFNHLNLLPWTTLEEDYIHGVRH